MSFESPVSVLFNTEGLEIAVSQSQAIGTQQPGLAVLGSGSNGFEFLRLGDDGAIFVTGSVSTTLSGEVDQGNAGTIAQSWYVSITDGTQVIGVDNTAPLWITGSVTVDGAVSIVGTADVNVTNTVDVSVTNTVDVNVTNTVEVTGTVGVTSIASPVTVRMMDCPNTVVTGFGSNTVNVTVLPANPDRCGATFFMDGNATAFIKLGVTASISDFTVKMLNNGYFELPGHYTGQVDVIFDKVDAARVLRVTEISE